MQCTSVCVTQAAWPNQMLLMSEQFTTVKLTCASLLVLVEPFYGGGGGAVFVQPAFDMGPGPGGDDGSCGKFNLNKLAHGDFSSFVKHFSLFS